MERAVGEGFELLAMGPPLIRDPDVPRRMQAGELLPRAAAACNLCVVEMERGAARWRAARRLIPGRASCARKGVAPLVILVCAHRIPCSADAFWSMLHEDPYESRWRGDRPARVPRLERHENPSGSTAASRWRWHSPTRCSRSSGAPGRAARRATSKSSGGSRNERVVRWRITPNTFGDRARASGSCASSRAGRRAASASSTFDRGRRADRGNAHRAHGGAMVVTVREGAKLAARI